MSIAALSAPAKPSFARSDGRFSVCLALLAASALCLWAAPAAASCRCRELSTLDALKGASAVFEGRVLAVSPQREDRSSVRLHVVRAWKGADQEELVLTTPSAGDCGAHFETAESYLVYASAKSDGQGLATTRCAGTKPLSRAQADLRVLGMGHTPVEPHPLPAEPPNPEPPARAGCAGCTTGGSGSGTAPWWAPFAAAIVSLLIRKNGSRDGSS